LSLCCCACRRTQCRSPKGGGNFLIFRYIDKAGEFESESWKSLRDAAYLHITAFSAAAFSAGAFIGKVLGQPNHATSHEATLHLVKGVRILRERLLLRDEEGKVSDATVSVILTLANCAYGMGEYEAAKRHLKGLCKISMLRRGLPNFRHNNLSKRHLMEMLR
jgi:hypothetical protein